MKTKKNKTSIPCLRIVVTLQTGLQEYLKAERGEKRGFWFVSKPVWYLSHQIVTSHGVEWISVGTAANKAELLRLVQDNFTYIQSIDCVLVRES